MRILFLIALLCYFTSGGFLAFRILSEKNQLHHKDSQYRIAILLCMTSHGGLLLTQYSNENSIHLSLGFIISLAAWMSVTFYLVSSLFRRTLNLGIIMIPIGLIGIIIGYLNPGTPAQSTEFSRELVWHIAIAIPAYGILCVAFAQAILLFVQEKQLHRPNPISQLKFLPAIETMESNLFWLTIAGFVLLTLNLFIGSFFTWHHYGKLMLFNHHIILSIIAWLCFGFLLLGRRLFGWRGENAAKWTMASFAILALGYFGTRFVRDIILG